MVRKRNKENIGLPKRWKFHHGAYYYQVPPGKEDSWDGKKLFRLGKTPSEAHRVYAQRIEVPEKIKTIAGLLDRYLAEVTPLKAASTRREEPRHIRIVNTAFGQMRLDAIKPMHVYQYYDKHPYKRQARFQISVLRHAFSKAVEWGYMDTHPFKKEVKLIGEKPRDRYVEDWEIIETLSLEPVRLKGSVKAVQAYIRLKMLLGLRKGDLLRLKVSDCKDDGIHLRINKTGKAIIYQWTPALRTAIDIAKDSRPVDISPHLFCNKYGKSYMNEQSGRPDGWNSMWQRFMLRVLAETELKERFTEHDLRAKVASDAGSLERAQELLAHADSKLTQKHYRRKTDIITPAQ